MIKQKDQSFEKDAPRRQLIMASVHAICHSSHGRVKEAVRTHKEAVMGSVNREKGGGTGGERRGDGTG